MKMRRTLVLLTVALLLVPAAPAFAQAGNEDPPATGGPSGTGGNTPNAGNTGGGTESPSRGNDSGASGTVLAVVGLGLLVVAVAVLASTRRRERRAEAGDPVPSGDTPRY
ncbi:MAG TPA: hypothetical protein VF045_09085 [Acidimicrobiales bacterium]